MRPKAVSILTVQGYRVPAIKQGKNTWKCVASTGTPKQTCNQVLINPIEGTHCPNCDGCIIVGTIPEPAA